jgi:hypothetical protein
MALAADNFKHEISSLKLFQDASLVLARDAHPWPISPGGNQERAQ